MTKETVIKAIEKVKAAHKLLNEVDEKIDSCFGGLNWHIYRVEDFKQICKILNIEYFCIGVDDNGRQHLQAHYDGLDIISIDKAEKSEVTA